MARSRARATSPPNRAGTILVAKNGSRPFPDKLPVPWLDRGLIKGSSYPLRSSPIRGIQQPRKCTISVSEKEALGIVGIPHVIAVC